MSEFVILALLYGTAIASRGSRGAANVCLITFTVHVSSQLKREITAIAGTSGCRPIYPLSHKFLVGFVKVSH